jgi:hypothetical protein
MPRFDAEVIDGLVAAAVTVTIPDVLPPDWFDEPVGIRSRGAFYIEQNGRVYGRLARRRSRTVRSKRPALRSHAQTSTTPVDETRCGVRR